MNPATLINSFFRRLRSGVVHDPARDWLTLLTLAALVLVAISMWNVWNFDAVARDATTVSAATSTPSGLKKASLDTIHGIFDIRAAENAKYVTGAYRFTDPSQ